MALKKPSDLFNKEESSVVFKSSEISSNITETYDRFRDNLDKVNVLSEQIEYLSQQLSEKMTRTDLENAMLSNLMVLDENFKSIRNQVKGLNKEDLKEFKVNISNLTGIVGNLVETELPKYKKQITNNEVRISNQFANFKEEIGERIQKFYEVINEFNDVVQVIDTVSNIENYIQEHHQDLVNLREEVFTEIEKLSIGNFQENLERLEQKIDFIKETYSKIEPEIIVKEVIKEGLLNEPPETKNSDPLTSLDQNFVTLDQLQNHYRLFINRIQQQLSTLGGSGETRLKYLDDIVGIATNASAYDGKFLKYNHSIGKFIFDTAGINYWGLTSAGIHTLSNVGVGTTNPQTKLEINGVLGFTDSNIKIGNVSTGTSITYGSHNFFAGNYSGQNTTEGFSNNFLGCNAGYANTSGYENNFFGYSSGYNNTNGSDNNFLSSSAGQNNTTGSNNNFFGYSSGYQNTTGNNNIFVGQNAGTDNVTGSENIILGYNQNAPIINGSNQLVIGAGSTTWIIGNSSYNIGIGTTNPTSKLTVTGDVLVSGVVTATSINFASGGVLGDLYTDGGIGIGVRSPANYYAIVASNNLQQFLQVDDNQIFITTGYASTTGTYDWKFDRSGALTFPDSTVQYTAYTGIATYSTSSGIATYASTAGIATFATTAGYATTAGISTTSQGLTGTPNISVGVITATDYRIQSVAEKTTIVGLNTANLVYNTGGGNVAICTNPSGDITLNVTGIPTDSNFNNYSLAFSVIVTNTGTARSCTAITLNGVSKTIKWFGGSLSAAISGVTTSNGYDVYSFTGINTVGSASTTANYIVLGSVNGSYR